jgi:hypothetical protein
VAYKSLETIEPSAKPLLDLDFNPVKLTPTQQFYHDRWICPEKYYMIEDMERKSMSLKLRKRRRPTAGEVEIEPRLQNPAPKISSVRPAERTNVLDKTITKSPRRKGF